MKSIISVIAVTFSTIPAFAAVEVVPAPAIGLGLPAFAAVLVVGLIAVVLKYRKAQTD